MAIVTLQRRMMELGRVRTGGEKQGGRVGKKLTEWRFTSASRALLEAVAARYGGEVTAWDGATEEGYFQVYTTSNALDILLPPVFSDVDGHPTTAYSQWFELWSGGGCQRRCDGVTEALKGKSCMCNPEARECKPTTRVSFMLPDIPGLGVWRLETKGINAAIELPGTLEILMLAAAEHKFIPAVLRIESRTSKKEGEPTKRYTVPVLDLPNVTVQQLASGQVPLALNAPVPAAPKPELPRAVPPPPDDPRFQHSNGDDPGWGPGPAIPSAGAAADGPATEAQDEASTSDAPAGDPQLASDAQKKKLNVMVGKLRDDGHISTEQLYIAGGLNPLDWLGEDAALHWSPLRDMLTKDQAHALIDRLTKYEANLPALAAAGVPGAEETP